VTPVITAVSPASLEPSSTAQTITISGAGFQNGLTLSVTSQTRVTSSVLGANITNVTSTSFFAHVTMSLVGSYTLQVRNPDGTSSNSVAFTVAKPTPTQPAADPIVTFAASDPAPGSKLVATSSPALSMTFSVVLATALPQASLEAQLLDGSGAVCGFGFSITQDLPVGTTLVAIPTMLLNGGADTPCAKPTTTAIVQATLRAPDYVNPAQPRIYAQPSFPIAYPVQQYPDIPPGLVTPPTISSLTWQSETAGCGDCLLAGETVNVTCTVKAADGAAATVSLVVTWDAGPSSSGSQAFPTGATAAQNGASFTLSPTEVGSPPRATAACTVVNVRGETATATIRIQ